MQKTCDRKIVRDNLASVTIRELGQMVQRLSPAANKSQPNKEDPQ